MSAGAWVWAAVGLSAGVLHAVSLWRSARRPASIEGLFGVLRVLGVGALLLVAALGHGLVPAAVGWALAFPTVGVLLLRRSPR